MDLIIITTLPVVTKDLPISPRFTPYLTTRQPMLEFYLLTFPRFPLRKKEHNAMTYFVGKNRTHDFHPVDPYSAICDDHTYIHSRPPPR